MPGEIVQNVGVNLVTAVRMAVKKGAAVHEDDRGRSPVGPSA